MAVSKRVRYEVFRRDNNRCRYCGATAPDAPMTIDHVIPVALGGSDDPSNLVTACRDCNAGKTSSSPDAPLVADVAADAIRWGKAMQAVAEQRAADREVRRNNHHAFLENSWRRWTYGSKNEYFDLPNNWQSSIDQFIAGGLDLDDLDELVDVAMNSTSRDPWKYFCGCCWRRIENTADAASKIVAAQEEPPKPAPQPGGGVTSRWTWEEIGQLWVTASERLAAAQGTSVDDVLSAIHPCPHSDEGTCGDPICDVLEAARWFGKAYVIEQEVDDGAP